MFFCYWIEVFFILAALFIIPYYFLPVSLGFPTDTFTYVNVWIYFISSYAKIIQPIPEVGQPSRKRCYSKSDPPSYS